MLASRLFVVSLFFGVFSIANANPGINWLQSQMQADGGIYTTEDEAIPFQTHAEVLRTLNYFNSTINQQTALLGFLDNEPYAGTEYLARKIIAHLHAGQAVTVMITALLQHQNVDGGFGELSHYDSSILDTAFALEALALAGYHDSIATSNAIDYLLARQGADGGWAQAPNDSQTYLTALSLSAVFHYRHYVDVQNCITAARTYLLNKRQATQLWASSFETALALIAIAPTLVDRGVIADSLSTLEQLQQANGSYHSDVYQTALALRAFKLAELPAPDEILLRGRVIDGDTGLSLSGAVISLSGKTTRTISSDSQGQFELRDLQAGAHQLTLSLTGYATLSSTFNFVSGQQQNLGNLALLKASDARGATLLGQVTEADTGLPLAGVPVSLKQTVAGFSVTAISDASGQYQISAIPAGDIAIQVQSPTHERLDRLVSLSAGEVLIFSPALLRSNVTVFGVVSDRNSGAPIIGASIQVQSARNQVSATSNSLGEYRIPDVHAEDLSITASFAVYQPVTVVVKALHGSTIRFSPALLRMGETAPPLNNAMVTGRVLDETNGQPLAKVVVNLDDINSGRVQTDSEGRFTFQSLAAGAVQLSLLLPGYEARTLNTTVNDFVHLDLGAILLRPDNVLLLTTVSGGVIDARNGQPLANANIIFAGGGLSTLSAADGRYQLLANNNLNGEIQFSLAGYRDVRFRINVEAGESVELIDVRMRPEEAEQLIPDLRVAAIETDGLITDLQTLNIAGDVQIDIENRGHAEASAGFEVQVFYDSNGDGAYTAGIDTALGKRGSDIPIAAGAVSRFAVTIAGNIPFRDAKLHVFLDAGQTLIELNENNNIASSLCPCAGDQCTPTVGTLEPQLKWQWFGSGISHMPVVGPLIDTNGDDLVNEHDVPVVLAKTFNGLQAIRGDTAQTVWTFNNGQMAGGTGDTPAIGDLDGDGFPEVVTYQFDKRIVAVNGQGQQIWVSSEAIAISTQFSNSLSLADLDGDGHAEILAESLVLNSDGSLRWRAPVGTSVTTPLAADINLDGRPEVIIGGHVFDADGHLLWNIAKYGQSVFRGFAAVANLDDDDYAEIIMVIQPSHSMMALEHDGTLKWGPIVLPGLNGGSPVIVDVDNDGEVEIGVEVSPDKFLMFEADGSLKWSQTINDPSTGTSGASAFDFDNDGRVEIVFQDHNKLYLFDGASGEIKASLPNTSLTWTEYPIVVDVDADGHADIVALNGSSMTAYTDANNSWQATRTLWNQHVYHIDNVNPGGGIPAIPEKSWLTHNSFRMNSAPPPMTSQPDLSLARLQLIEQGTGLPLQAQARIGNAGDLTSPENIEVAFYRGAPENGGVLLGTVKLPTIEAGQFLDISLAGINTLTTGDTLVAVIDPMNMLAECRENNNRIALQTHGKQGIITINSSPGNILPYSDIQFNITVHNPGSLAAAYTVQTVINDTNGVRVTNLPPQTLAQLSAGETTTLNQNWNSGPILAGDYRAHATLFNIDGTSLTHAETIFAIREGLDAIPLASLRSTTNSTEYHTTDTVQLEHLLQNISLSTLLNNIQLHTEIKTPAGILLQEHTQDSGNLAPSGFKLIHESLALQAAAQGQYTINTQLLSNGHILAQAQTNFIVAENLRLALSVVVK